ncbi:MAG TPA: helix-turn-helix domain-containing protein [Candidatus Baltobacteraceae bacterium]|jgi:transcriptional regulator with XRE-family HTH domain|nr:helix-turn-helix domain-containing protein [Candidatus Baltobacteraceae bacterium]
MMMPVDIGQRIGQNLARIMKVSSLTHGQVAARAGLSQPTVSALVGGQTKDPPIGTLLKITQALSLPLDDLLADVTPADVDETERLSNDRLTALERDLAALNDRVALVLDQMPVLVSAPRRTGKRSQPK